MAQSGGAAAAHLAVCGAREVRTRTRTRHITSHMLQLCVRTIVG